MDDAGGGPRRRRVVYHREQGKGESILSPYLEVLKAHRSEFTVFSGVRHPNVDGQHASDVSFLTAAPFPGTGSFRNTISLDQYISERIGSATRFPSITPAVNSRTRSLSYNELGAGRGPSGAGRAR